MREKKIPTDILKMLKTGIGLALLPPRPYLFDDLTETTDLLDDDRALAILNDTTITSERREAFAQQTKIGWTSLFMGYDGRMATFHG